MSPVTFSKLTGIGMTMRSYKLILPKSIAGHITYSKERLRSCSGLGKYFNVKWGRKNPTLSSLTWGKNELQEAI